MRPEGTVQIGQSEARDVVAGVGVRGGGVYKTVWGGSDGSVRMEIPLHGFCVSKEDPVPIRYDGADFYVFWFTLAVQKAFFAPHTVVF